MADQSTGKGGYRRRDFLRYMALGAGAVGLSASGLLLAGCGAGSTGGGGSESPSDTGGTSGGGSAEVKPITIALVTALTGPNANWGQRTSQGFEVAVDLVNQAGGIQSKGGAPIELKLYDTQSKPEVAGQQTEKAISDGAVILSGTNQSAATLVATQVSERNQVPFICGSDIDPLITGRGFKYTFRTSPIVKNYAYDLIDYYKFIGESTGNAPQKVAILCENSVVGSSAAEFFEEAAERNGLEVIATDTYDAASTSINFTSYISRYKAAGADILVGHNKPADAVAIVRTSKELEFNPLAIGFAVGGAVEVSFVESLGADSDYVTGTDGFSIHINNPEVKAADEAYRAKYNVTIDSNSAQGFSVTAVIWDALERAASLSPTDVRDAIAATNLNTGDKKYIHLTGAQFNEIGDNAKAASVVWQLKDGVWNPIYPEEYANTEVVWPKPAW